MELEEIKKFRTDKQATARALFKAFVKDPRRYCYCEVWFKKFYVNLDSVAYNESGLGDSLGKVLDDLVFKASSADEVHTLATLVFPWRAKIQTFRDLLKAYFNDKTKFAPLKQWFEKNPFDVDTIPYDPAQSYKETIGQIIDNHKKDDELAVLVRPHRAAEMKALRELAERL